MYIEHQRGGNIGVPEDLRQRFGVKSMLHTAGRKGVPQRVEGVVANVMLAEKALVAPVKAMRFHKIGVARQQIGVVGTPVFEQMLRQKFRERDHARRAVGLRLADDQLCFSFGERIRIGDPFHRPADPNGAIGKINVLPFQTAQFPDAHAGKKSKKNSEARRILGTKQRGLQKDTVVCGKYFDLPARSLRVSEPVKGLRAEAVALAEPVNGLEYA